MEGKFQYKEKTKKRITVHPLEKEWFENTFIFCPGHDLRTTTVWESYHSYFKTLHIDGLPVRKAPLVGKILRQVFPQVERMKMSKDNVKGHFYLDLDFRTNTTAADSETSSSLYHGEEAQDEKDTDEEIIVSSNWQGGGADQGDTMTLIAMEEEESEVIMLIDHEEDDPHAETTTTTTTQTRGPTTTGMARRDGSENPWPLNNYYESTEEDCEIFRSVDIASKSAQAAFFEVAKVALWRKQHPTQHMRHQYYTLQLEADCYRMTRFIRYIDIFSEMLWPILPMPWCIVDRDLGQTYYQLGHTEQALLELYFGVVLFSGASMMHDENIFQDVFYKTMKVVEAAHENNDIRIVPALCYMACNTFNAFEPVRAFELAMSYIVIAEATLAANNDVSSEMYWKIQCLKQWLTAGNDSCDLPADGGCVVAEAGIDISACKKLRTDIERVMNVRNKVTYVQLQAAYLERVLYLVRSDKKEALEKRLTETQRAEGQLLFSTETHEESLLQTTQYVRFARDLKKMRLNALAGLKAVKGHIANSCLCVLKTHIYSIIVQSLWELKKKKKAVKYIRKGLDLLVKQISIHSFFMHFRWYPLILASCGAWHELDRLIAEGKRYPSSLMAVQMVLQDAIERRKAGPPVTASFVSSWEEKQEEKEKKEKEKEKEKET